MRQVSKMLVMLDVETAVFHAEADAPWHHLVESASRFDYIHHLVQRYGFDAPLEAALAYTPQLEDRLPDLHRRYRAGLIAKDLLTLGVTAGDITNLRQCMIAPFVDVPEALGWLYVHQRSTLVFESVYTELTRRLPELEPATSYLRCREGHVGLGWEDLGQALEHAATKAASESRIIAAAKDAFRAAIEWNGRGKS